MITIQELEVKFPVVLELLRLSRDWHAREQKTYAFHPIIKEIMKTHVPQDYRLLALEYPHQSIKDASNVAYTRDERSGINDRQTVTTFGRYIRRMFPQLKDHEIRDYATKCRNDIYEIWDTKEGIIKSVQLGPRSCMTWDSSYTPDHEYYDPSLKHPYMVYAPELGWKAVVRLDPDTRTINGRGLVWHSEDESEQKFFVRTYKRGSDYSYADEALEYWLKESGYKHVCAWPDGTPLKLIPYGHDFLAPYIDGDIQRVSKGSVRLYKDVKYSLYIDECGEHECTQTDGETEDCASEYCHCCDEHYHPDDMRNVYDEDDVCEGCADSYYVQAYIDNTRFTDRVHQDNVIEYNNEYYHKDYLDDHEIVELVNGDYAKLENTYETNCGNYVLDEDVSPNGDWVLIANVAYPKSELFYCNGSNEWYLMDDVTPVEFDGKEYHPEHMPEVAKESE